MVLIVKCARCGAVIKRIADLGGRPLAEIVGGRKCSRCGVEVKGKIVDKLTITPSRILAERRFKK